jgi:hypothetical protein
MAGDYLSVAILILGKRELAGKGTRELARVKREEKS